jgi:hypothetical protein
MNVFILLHTLPKQELKGLNAFSSVYFAYIQRTKF